MNIRKSLFPLAVCTALCPPTVSAWDHYYVPYYRHPYYDHRPSAYWTESLRLIAEMENNRAERAHEQKLDAVREAHMMQLQRLLLQRSPSNP